MLRQAVKDGQIQELDEQELDVELQSPSRLWSTHTNSIPMPSSVQVPRIFYGGRFFNQAVPLVNPEAALVQNLDEESGESFDRLLGEKMGAVRSKSRSRVLEADDQHIRVQDLDTGEERDFELYNRRPFNRFTTLTQTPLVKAGDRVEPGQVLARSNYTNDQGDLAMTVNARVGLVPYKGWSMDDAIVISQRMADRLTSQQTYVEEQEWDENTKGGKKHFQALFPTAYRKALLDQMDDEGVVRPGTVLEPGDPYVLATRPRMFNSQVGSMGRMSRAMQQTRSDASRVWEHEHPGTVVDVARTKNGVKVMIESQTPTQVGDKIVFRAGQKSFHPDTEVLTERGWVRIPDLLNTDKVAALFNDAPDAPGTGVRARENPEYVARFVKPLHAHSYEYDGELYGLNAVRASYLVTPNHRIWRCGHMGKSAKWYCQDAQQVEGTPQKLMMAADFDLSERRDPEYIEFEPARNDYHDKDLKHPTRFPFRAWVRFMALYLAEGNIRHSKPSTHSILITQKERPFCREIEGVLADMGLGWKRVNIQYVVGPNKTLRRYLEQFGKAPDKFVPEEIKRASAETLRSFVDTIWQGDGDKYKGKEYWSTSKQLVSDLQGILAQLGEASTICEEKPTGFGTLQMYCLRRLDSRTTSTKKDYGHAFYREQYKGPVYCIQVPGLGVIQTRFRGKMLWVGNSVVSKILPDEHMPRTVDGEPLEVLLNPLGLPSRANTQTVYELLLGKVAKKRGAPIKVPAFNKPGEKWYELVEKLLTEEGLSDKEEVFDPQEQRKLENPITVGYAPILKLQHMAEKKLSARGQGSYDQDAQPLKGGSDAAQSKRLSTLEIGALMSSGAYANLRESSTLRGQQSDEFWKAIRSGHTPPQPGSPFVWDKFQALLQGSGYLARDLGQGNMRLGPFTDKRLDELRPHTLKSGDSVNPETLEPVAGGLFDPVLVGGGRWGQIELAEPVPNPAFEKQIAQLLGIRQADVRRVLAGEAELDEVRK